MKRSTNRTLREVGLREVGLREGAARDETSGGAEEWALCLLVPSDGWVGLRQVRKIIGKNFMRHRTHSFVLAIHDLPAILVSRSARSHSFQETPPCTRLVT